MNQIVEVEIAKIHRAEYNPRYISPEKISLLRESTTTLGIIKPIIIRKEDGRILAGHQRSRSEAENGKTHIKAFVLENVNSSDEVRFNQLHNFSECEISDRAPIIVISVDTPVNEFAVVKNTDITIVKPGEKNHAVNQLSKMILRYGQFGNAVIDHHGNVIISSVYAKAIKLLGLDLWVYRLSEDKVTTALKFFSYEYGEFSYKHIEKKTYIQCLAQKFRLRSENRSHSTLYEKIVIPNIKKSDKILDFGAGQRDYAKMLQAKGYNIHTIEFFLRKPGKDVIWMEEIANDFKKIVTQLSYFGQYDVVVCDSVLNSVDSIEAQNSVLISLSALCKPGGMIYWSGIPIKFKKQHIDRKNTYDNKESSAFLDEEGFTGNYRYGEWYFQKYHTRKDVEELTKRFFSNTFTIFDRGIITKERELNGSSFQVATLNDKRATTQMMNEALTFEFSLPLPNGKRHELAPHLIKAWEKSNRIISTQK